MKPIKVNAGEWSEYEDLLAKAKEMEEKLEKANTETDNSELRDVRGVEEVRPAHYWTNQQLPDHPETVNRCTPEAESYRFREANPHSDDGAWSAHMTDGGGDRPAGITNEKTLFGKADMCACGDCPAKDCTCSSGCDECKCNRVKKSQLLGAWKEDDPFVLQNIAEQAESLTRRL